jgi:ABC-type Mn2+/Zn2+ transport system permease subunit
MNDLIGLIAQFRWAVFASVLTGAICPLLGVYFVMRRMILLGIALPQVSSAGIAFVVMIAQLVKLHFLPSGESPFLEENVIVSLAPIGSIGAIFLILFILSWQERKGGAFTEARWGSAYISAASLLIIFLIINPYAEAHVATMLEGRIITVTQGKFWTLLNVSVIVTFLFILFRKEFILTSFDPEMAASLGFRTTRWNAGLYILIGIVISVGVMNLGPLFVFGYLLLPAFAARPWAVGMKQFYIYSVILGALAAFIGSVFSFWLDWPLAPTEVVIAAIFLLISRIVLFFRRSLFQACVGHWQRHYLMK